MTKKKINKKELGKLLSQWSQQFAVLTPTRDGNGSRMAPWDGEDTGFLDWYRNTTVSARAVFQPFAEEMFRFQKDGDGYHIEATAPEDRKRLLFGIRPCDARALTIIDMSFKDGYEDPYYLTRRNNALLVGLGCTNPRETCFCTSLGVNPGESKDVDLMLTDIGDYLLIEEVTPAGSDLLAQTGGLEEATEVDEARAREATEAVQGKVTRKIDTKNIQEKLLAGYENREYWEQVSAKCISCGICTLLCPTCYCFDINDELVKKQGTRFRSCDSCAFSIYTRMPVENPREEKWQRVRQKVAHKYEFYPMNFDVIACTGCGRCIRLCPVNWDITQTLESLPSGSAT
ncbi:Anaerobic sulfite reductase subunit A [subsurface metagenome]